MPNLWFVSGLYAVWHLLIVCLCLLTWASRVAAQDTVVAAQDTVKVWDHGLVGAITLSQVTFKDWAQGGESALAWTLGVDGQNVRDAGTVGRTIWATAYKFAFGQTRQGDRGFRKTDDKIDLETVWTYKVGTFVNPFVSSTLKTQFANGFKFDDRGNGVRVSQFFDPAYLTQTTGAGYQPITQIRTRFGFGLRETITRDFNSFADDPNTVGIEKTKVEGGFESVTNVKLNLAENIIYTGRFETFLALRMFEDPIVRIDSTLAMRVNRYISTNLNVQIVKDVLASPRTQIKQVLSVGVSHNFL